MINIAAIMAMQTACNVSVQNANKTLQKNNDKKEINLKYCGYRNIEDCKSDTDDYLNGCYEDSGRW